MFIFAIILLFYKILLKNFPSNDIIYNSPNHFLLMIFDYNFTTEIK